MPWNGSGSFSRNQDYTADKAAGAPDHFISAAKLDEDFNNIITGLENTLTRDGQNAPTANLPMNAKKHTNIANASARNEYAAAGQIQDGGLVYAVDSGAADAYEIAPAPALTAYVAGQLFRFRAANANTGASTLNVNGIGTRAIVDQDGNALRSGMIGAGAIMSVVYDGAQFVLVSASAGLSDAAYTGIGTSGATIPLLDGDNSFSGTADFSGDVRITAAAAIDVSGAAGGLSVVSDLDTGTTAQLSMGGHDSGGSDTVYARLECEISDATDGSESGAVTIQTAQSGTLSDRIHIAGGLYGDGVIGGDPGAGKANFVDVQIDGTSIFPDESLSSDGYAEFGNGLILQWGQISVPSSSSAVETFPISFPNGCFSVTFGYNVSNFGQTLDIDSFTASQVTFYNSTSSGATMYWIAVGH